MGYDTADDQVKAYEFKDILAVLAGPSPWREYIAPNLKTALANIPSDAFQIVSEAKFKTVMDALGGSQELRKIGGVTDKKQGRITMQEWGPNSGASKVGWVLHETVHLVSHHAGRGPLAHSLAWSYLGEGLLEGLVETVTRDVLEAQGIKQAEQKYRGHEARVPVAVALLERFGIALLGRLLFRGDFHDFVRTMHEAYLVRGWEQIKMLATSNQTAPAITGIKTRYLKGSNVGAYRSVLSPQIERNQLF